MKTFVLSALVCLLLNSCTNKQSEIYSDSSAAINGYDPVAYFAGQMPVMGSQEFSYEWKDANWLFLSQQNLELFQKDPEKYAPRYGGAIALMDVQRERKPLRIQTRGLL